MGRPPRAATTMRRSSAAESAKPRTSSSTRRPPDTSSPAGSWACADWSAAWSSPSETDSVRSLSGSGSTRTTRRAPPTTLTFAVRGTFDTSRAVSSASARSAPGASGSAACSVTVMNGTSSMVRERTRGAELRMRRQLLVHLHEARFERLVHLEPHGQETDAGAARAVQVLDPRNAPQPPLDGRHELALDLGRGRAGERQDHVHHRDDDLRLLLARREDDGADAEQDRREDDDWGELGAQERARQAPGQPERRLVFNDSATTGWPSLNAPGSAITTSPTRSPARTAMSAPACSPTEIQRSSARPPLATNTPVRSPRSTSAVRGSQLSSPGSADAGRRSRANAPERSSPSSTRSCARSPRRCDSGSPPGVSAVTSASPRAPSASNRRTDPTAMPLASRSARLATSSSASPSISRIGWPGPTRSPGSARR